MSDIMYHLPAVALRGTTILPDMIVHFDVSREKSIQAIEQAMMQDQRILLITQKNPETEEPVQEDLYPIGTIAEIKQLVKLPKNIVRVLVEGIERAQLVSLEENPKILAKSGKIKHSDIKDIEDAIDYVCRNLDLFLKHFKMSAFEYDDDDFKDDLRKRGEYK